MSVLTFVIAVHKPSTRGRCSLRGEISASQSELKGERSRDKHGGPPGWHVFLLRGTRQSFRQRWSAFYRQRQGKKCFHLTRTELWVKCAPQRGSGSGCCSRWKWHIAVVARKWWGKWMNSDELTRERSELRWPSWFNGFRCPFESDQESIQLKAATGAVQSPGFGS